MLQSKAISINLEAVIKVDDKDIVTIYKTINSDGTFGSVAQNINDTEVYSTNIEQIRKDREEFESMCMNIQDRLIDGSLLNKPLENKEA